MRRYLIAVAGTAIALAVTKATAQTQLQVELVRTIDVHPSPIRAIDIDAPGRSIGVGTSDGKVLMIAIDEPSSIIRKRGDVGGFT